jgi:hypothetical protein
MVAVVSLLASASVAGTPTVTVYFDEDLTMRSVDRMNPGLQTLYIVAEGFDAQLTSMEYKIDYPVGMTWIEDIEMPPVKIGSTPKGVTQAWGMPVDGNEPVVIAKALVRWEPDLSASGEVAVTPHPVFGFVRATAAPDHRIIEARGERSRIRPQASARGSVPELDRAYPNPFNPVTQITYWVPERTQVRLTVYDVAGREVASLVNEVRDRGEHSVEWRADNIPSGVYFYRLDVGGFSERRKVMLLK